MGWLLILGLKEGLVECATVLGHTNRQQHQCQCQNADLAPIHIHTTKKHTTYIILPLIPFGKLLETFFFWQTWNFFLIMMLLKSWVKDTFSKHTSCISSSCHFEQSLSWYFCKRNFLRWLWTVIEKNTADYDACYVSKVWWFVFILGWSGSTLIITKHIIKVGSKS